MNSLQGDFQRSQVQQSYTDLNQLNSIKQLGKQDQGAALRKVAEQFESMFIHMMIKSMRSASEVFAKDNPLNTNEMKFHNDMLDNQMSLNLSQQGGFGLADALYRQLSGQYLDSANNRIDATGVARTDSDEIDRNKTNSSEAAVSKSLAEQLVNRRVSQNPYVGPYASSGDYASSGNNDDHAKADQKLLENINSPQEFIDAITPYAKEVAAELNTDYRFIVAQTALETGWGEHVISDRYGRQSFNLFNIKADSRWQGHHVNVSTIEYDKGVAVKESANFRRYDSIAESFADYKHFLTQPRYQQALRVSENGHDFIQGLHQAGYATDPEYSNKIANIVKQYF